MTGIRLMNAGFQGMLVGVMVLAMCLSAHAQAEDGEGVDSQTMWVSPGPSNFATVQSSDITGHLNVTFSAMFGYHRKPLGLLDGDSETHWVVKDAFGADFAWAFGLADILQVGLVMPVVFFQNGEGVELLKPDGAPESDYALAGSALRDIRLQAKGRFLGGKAENQDRRGFGLALDVGVTLPTGDELNFAGEEGPVLFPTAIIDFHKCMFSAAINLGARIRFKESEKLVDNAVGSQAAFGLGVTGHFVQRKLLLSAESTGLIEFDGRVGIEYRGAVGYRPDKNGEVTLWLAGGSAAGTGDLLGTPALRAMAGITYAPGNEDDFAF